MITLVKDVAGIRNAAIGRVNGAAGAVRSRYITTIPGQEMLYLKKEETARAYLALDPEPETLEDFPLLACEIGITAPTAYELAQVWLNMSAQLEVIAGHLETLRLGTIAQLEAATTVHQISSVETTFQAAIGSFDPI